MVDQIPLWLQKALDLKGVQRIEAAVRQAELTTSGEIVPMIVRRSTINAAAPLTLALILLLLSVAIRHSFWPARLSSISEALWALAYALALGLGIYGGSSPWVQQRLLPRSEWQRQAQQRAMFEFYEKGLNNTYGRTGILLFVSWQECQAVVLADESIARHCPPELFRDVVTDLIQGAKTKDFAGGFERAISRCGSILNQHIPRKDGDRNELKDRLLITE